MTHPGRPTATDADAASAHLRDEGEAARIRSVFAARDRGRPRHAAIVEAYRRINADRQIQIEAFIRASSGASRPRILDVGCGAGLDLAFWLSAGWLPNELAGVDLVDERIRAARERCAGVDLRITSGTNLPFDSATFDVATAVTVFSSILDDRVRRHLFVEMVRVVRPGGCVLVYDFVVRNPRNRDVVAMTPHRLLEMGGRPTTSRRITPWIHLVALGVAIGERAGDLAMALAPRTHRLTQWQIQE